MSGERTVLRTLKEAFDQIEASSYGWNRLFTQMHNQMVESIEDNRYSFDEARKSENFDKNRYIDVLPYDHNRIKLTEGAESKVHTDYINASPLRIDSVGRSYILAQGPLKETSTDFWQMVWDYRVPAIIMLNRIVEGGMIKCYEYFPTASTELQHGPFSIACKDSKNNDGFVHRMLELKKKGVDDAREVHHIQYTLWPDHGVPPSTGKFLSLLAYIRNLNVLSNSIDDPPVVVHCSAGIGRTGTFVLVDVVMKLLDSGVAETKIDIPGLVSDMRKMRCGLIQTPQQLRFAWASILTHLEKTATAAATANGSGTAKTIESAGDEVEKEKNGRIKVGTEQPGTVTEKTAHTSSDKKRRSESSGDREDEIAKRWVMTGFCDVTVNV
ncbi:hypothetical protein WR25_15101 [Diploscapter pachys]|uniref:protein-tyrosine-phosphatase n=1 Tax=Diploscapter pachys TaxID=2018661 RepID=A0A2A2LLY4_9BILA|nr:hypothetical protein WR25_15101 [Diploscapter pachys]